MKVSKKRGPVYTLIILSVAFTPYSLKQDCDQVLRTFLYNKFAIFYIMKFG